MVGLTRRTTHAGLVGFSVWMMLAPLCAQEPSDDRLDAIVKRWQASCRETRNVSCEFELTRPSKLLAGRTTERCRLVAERHGLTRLETRTLSEAWVSVCLWENQELRWFDYKSKTEYLYAAPPPRQARLPLPSVADKLATRVVTLPQRFSFALFGMTAAEANTRFHLRLRDESAAGIRLELEPKTASDKQDFKLATVTLDPETYHPRELVLALPLGGQIQFRFRTFAVNVLDPSKLEVARTDLPAGWKRVPMLGAAKSILAN